jgi:hypothetical protein
MMEVARRLKIKVRMGRIFSFLAPATFPMPEARPVGSSIPLGERVEVLAVGIFLQNLNNRRIDRKWGSQSAGDTTSNTRRSLESFLSPRGM